MIFWYCSIFSIYCAAIVCKKEIHIIAWLYLVVISAFRFEVGTDYITYVNIYDSIINGAGNVIWSDKEIGYLSLIYISNLIGGNAQLVFAFFSIFTLLFFYLSSKNLFKSYNYTERLIVNSVFLVLFFGFLYFQSLNQVRQYFSLSICFYALTNVYRKKKITVIGFIFFSSLFHKSALFVLLSLPIFYIKPNINIKNILFIIIIGVLGPVSLIKGFYVSLKLPYYGYLSYAEFAEKTTGIGLFGTYVVCLVVSWLVLYCRKDKRVSDDYLIVAYASLLYIFIRLSALDFEQVNRLANFFKPFVYILISMGVLVFLRHIKNKLSKVLFIHASLFIISILSGLVYFSRSYNDYSYAHFSLNYCILGDVICPVIISE